MEVKSKECFYNKSYQIFRFAHEALAQECSNVLIRLLIHKVQIYNLLFLFLSPDVSNNQSTMSVGYQIHISIGTQLKPTNIFI